MLRKLRECTIEERDNIIDQMLDDPSKLEEWDGCKWTTCSGILDMNRLYRRKPSEPTYYEYQEIGHGMYSYLVVHPSNEYQYLDASTNGYTEKAQMFAPGPGADWIPCTKKDVDVYRFKLLPDVLYFVWRSGTNVAFPYLQYLKGIGAKDYSRLGKCWSTLLKESTASNPAKLLAFYDVSRDDKAGSPWKLITREECEKATMPPEEPTCYYVAQESAYDPTLHLVYAVKFVGDKHVEAVGASEDPLGYARDFDRVKSFERFFRSCNESEYRAAVAQVLRVNAERKQKQKQEEFDRAMAKVWKHLPSWAGWIHLGQTSGRWVWTEAKPTYTNGSCRVSVCEHVDIIDDLNGNPVRWMTGSGLIPGKLAAMIPGRPDGQHWKHENSLMQRPK